MAHRLSCQILVSATLLLLLAVATGHAQETKPSNPPPLPDPKPAAKELSAKKIDSLIEKTFGKESAERKRPIRLWLADLDMVIAAEKATVNDDGRSVQMNKFSAMIYDGALDSVTAIKEFAGQRAAIKVQKRIETVNELSRCEIESIEVENGPAVTVLTPIVPAPPVVPGPPEDGVVPVGRAVRPFSLHFRFAIHAKSPVLELLPASARKTVRPPLWTNEDLTKVPELTFGEPISKELSKHKAIETTAHVMAKINHLNAKKRDGFMLAMIEKRGDLRGLPFLMGDDCRTLPEQAAIFGFAADNIRQLMGNVRGATPITDPSEIRAFAEGRKSAQLPHASREPSKDKWYSALVAAMMQINMAEPASDRIEFTRILAELPHIDATKALARLAIFSPEDEVRAAAIEGLKLRREKDYTDVLMQGFRYPLPAVAKRAAEALVKLERKDLLANLVEVLESPDPRLPVTQKRDGNTVTFVRELVKVNHHRNCLLCHAPGNTADTPEGVLKVAVPLPGEPLPKPSEGGYQSTPPPSPDIVVRLDMTYLRQDFSVMMPVADAHPWPEMQRFDFLVRTRELSADEAKGYEPCCEPEEPGRLSPYHRSALYALRELTGRDTTPTASAWRELLKLPKR